MEKYIKYLIFISLLFVPELSRAQIWKVGDVIQNPDGSKGVVFWENPDGTGGWMVALHEEYENVQWCSEACTIPGSSYIEATEEALADTAGMQNTALIRDFRQPGITTAAQLVDFANGWYLPAAGQLRQLFAVLPFIEPVIKANKGKDLAEVSYWTSTQMRQDRAYNYSFQYGYIDFTIKLNNSGWVRPVRNYTNTYSSQDSTVSYLWNTGETNPGIAATPAASTIYTVTATSRNHCATRAAKQIFVSTGENTVIYDTIRRGEIYTAYGFRESDSGTYTRTLSAASGCDAGITLHLTVLEPIPPTVFTESICSGTTYSKHNFNAWEPGTYTQNWRTANGNDSAVILHLSVCHTYEHTIRASVCEGKKYTANGFNESEAGIYRNSFTTADGCDSVIILHLGVNPTFRHFLPATICEGQTYTANGFHESVEGNHTYHLRSKSGCDSIVTLMLDVAPVSRDTIDAAIHPGDTYIGHGFHESAAGIYTHTHTSLAGCDSLVTLRLQVLPSADTISASICEGETYSENGFNESQAGSYTRHLQTPAGLDSVITLQLTVHPAYDRHIPATICEGMVYGENGFSESVAGTYTHRFQTVQGCDSTVTLHLNVNNYFEGEITCSPEDCKTYTYRFSADNKIPGDTSRYTYQWNPGDDYLSGGPGLLYRYADSGKYEVTLLVKHGEDCAISLNTSVYVPYFTDQFEISADRTAVSDKFPEVKLWVTDIPGFTWHWDLGDGATSATTTVSHIYAIGSQPGYDVTLTAANAAGCTAEKTLRIGVEAGLFIPNTFSPNNDGTNDIFMPGYPVRIIDRNGVSVFSGDNGWDCSVKGVAAPEDTYFYILEYTNHLGKQKACGYITLFR